MSDVFPAEFKVEYVFFGGGANKLEVTGNKLIFYSESGVIRSDRTVSKREIKSSDEDWERFWNKLDEIRAWDWEKRYTYESEGIRVDGDIFKVNIKLIDKGINTFSWVKQPDESEKFFKALKELIKLDIQNPDALKM